VFVTRHRFWIDNSIYCILWYSMWLHFIVHFYTHTHKHVPCCCLVVASNTVGSPSSLFQKCPRPQLPASNSNSSWLNPSDSLTNCNNSKLCYNRRSVGQSVLVSSHIWGPRAYFCYWHGYGCVHVRRPLLTRVWVSRLQFHLALDSAVIFKAYEI
jgi:hypothetical protein